MTDKAENPVLKLALRVAQTVCDNSDDMDLIPVDARTLGEILKYIELLEKRLEYHISDQADEVKEVLLKISDIVDSADEQYYRSKDDTWWLFRLRNVIEEHS